jgi:hypothetical protein
VMDELGCRSRWFRPHIDLIARLAVRQPRPFGTLMSTSRPKRRVAFSGAEMAETAPLHEGSDRRGTEEQCDCARRGVPAQAYILETRLAVVDGLHVLSPSPGAAASGKFDAGLVVTWAACSLRRGSAGALAAPPHQVNSDAQVEWRKASLSMSMKTRPSEPTRA